MSDIDSLENILISADENLPVRRNRRGNAERLYNLILRRYPEEMHDSIRAIWTLKKSIAAKIKESTASLAVAGYSKLILIDVGLYPRLSQYDWFAIPARKNGRDSFDVAAYVNGSENPPVLLARLITGIEDENVRIIFRNSQPYDYRKANLKILRNEDSPYSYKLGISFLSTRKNSRSNWKVGIRFINGKLNDIGYYISKDAARQVVEHIKLIALPAGTKEQLRTLKETVRAWALKKGFTNRRGYNRPLTGAGVAAVDMSIINKETKNGALSLFGAKYYSRGSYGFDKSRSSKKSPWAVTLTCYPSRIKIGYFHSEAAAAAAVEFIDNSKLAFLNKEEITQFKSTVKEWAMRNGYLLAKGHTKFIPPKINLHTFRISEHKNGNNPKKIVSLWIVSFNKDNSGVIGSYRSRESAQAVVEFIQSEDLPLETVEEIESTKRYVTAWAKRSGHFLPENSPKLKPPTFKIKNSKIKGKIVSSCEVRTRLNNKYIYIGTYKTKQSAEAAIEFIKSSDLRFGEADINLFSKKVIREWAIANGHANLPVSLRKPVFKSVGGKGFPEFTIRFHKGRLKQESSRLFWLVCFRFKRKTIQVGYYKSLSAAKAVISFILSSNLQFKEIRQIEDAKVAIREWAISNGHTFLSKSFKNAADSFRQELGSETLYSTGKTYVKTSDGWVLKQQYIWTMAGNTFEKDHVIYFKDGNKNNFNIENLEMISKSEFFRRYATDRLPEEMRPIAIAIRKLKNEIATQEKLQKTNSNT